MSPNHYHTYRAEHGYPVTDMDEQDHPEELTGPEIQLEQDRLQLDLHAAAELVDPSVQAQAELDSEPDY